MNPSQTTAPVRLLKADSVRGLGSKVAFNFADLRQQGDAYLESVRRQADTLVQQAQRDAEQIRRQAMEQSIEAGRSEGLRQADESIDQRARAMAESIAREALATTLPAMKASADAIVLERDRWLDEWEKAAVSLAAAIAGRLVRHHVHVDRDCAGDMIRAALQLASGMGELTVRLHPEDVSLLGGHADDVVAALAPCGDARLEPDAAIARGGCFVESRHGAIDARIETLLDRIVAELLGDHAADTAL